MESARQDHLHVRRLDLGQRLTAGPIRVTAPFPLRSTVGKSTVSTRMKFGYCIGAFRAGLHFFLAGASADGSMGDELRFGPGDLGEAGRERGTDRDLCRVQRGYSSRRDGLHQMQVATGLDQTHSELEGGRLGAAGTCAALDRGRRSLDARVQAT